MKSLLKQNLGIKIEMEQKYRNQTIDFIKGVAILLVIFGHTITNITTGYENTVIYRIIWVLQMPLFMLVSGYITKYSKPITSFKQLALFLLKRTMAYLLPWFTFTFVIRGFLCGEPGFFNIKHLLFNMDIGYWFLFSLWSICVFVGIARYISVKITHKENKILKMSLLIGMVLIFMVLLFFMGIVFGFSFLCIKLTLYYFPFYLLGLIVGEFSEIIGSKKNKIWLNVLLAIAFVVFVFIILNINIFAENNILYSTIFRVVASLFGCLLVFCTFSRFKENNKVYKAVVYTGKKSLELYLIHYLFLSLIRPENQLNLMSFKGLLWVLASVALTLILSFSLEKIISFIPIAQFLMFGKWNSTILNSSK